MLVNICVKFSEERLHCLQVIEQTQLNKKNLHISVSKGHNRCQGEKTICLPNLKEGRGGGGITKLTDLNGSKWNATLMFLSPSVAVTAEANSSSNSSWLHVLSSS